MARLVAIGDSLTQGFQSAAITNPALSYPALVARCLGVPQDRFLTPRFNGSGGLPCNIEWLARRLEERYGANLGTFEWLTAVHAIASLLDEVEDYWERGPGSRPSASMDFHNLAVWGFEVADAYNIDAGLCRERLRAPSDALIGLPSEARLRTAYRVLNPSHEASRDRDTQLGIARRIGERDGGIDHLIVALGANNCLGTVVELSMRETTDQPPGPNSNYTLWTPRAFEREYERLADGVAAIGARHVYLATVPHVTIPPITRGVMNHRGRLPEDRKYFDYYTRFAIRDKEFDPASDPHLTRGQAEHIDSVIDRYNAVIRRVAGVYGFEVVDLCALLDSLAVRRNHGTPRYELPPAFADLNVRFFEIQRNGRLRNGGLISLDGVHPTSCGYALVAQLFVDKMRPHEPNIKNVDFAAVRQWDSLVAQPPRTLDDIFDAFQTLERHFHLSRWLAPRAPS